MLFLVTIRPKISPLEKLHSDQKENNNQLTRPSSITIIYALYGTDLRSFVVQNKSEYYWDDWEVGRRILATTDWKIEGKLHY